MKGPLSLKAVARVLAAMVLVLPPVVAAGDSKSAIDADAPEISIVTLNLWHDKGDWPKREKLIVATLRALRPDVISLQ